MPEVTHRFQQGLAYEFGRFLLVRLADVWVNIIWQDSAEVDQFDADFKKRDYFDYWVDDKTRTAEYCGDFVGDPCYRLLPHNQCLYLRNPRHFENAGIL